jgi:MFS family permease
MFSTSVSKNLGLRGKTLFAALFLISNALTWYFATFSLLASFLDGMYLSTFEASAIWAINSGAAACAALVSAARTSKLVDRKRFLSLWIVFGMISSIMPLFMAMTTFLEVATVAFVWGVAFGFGMPLAMECYVDNDAPENRGKIGGITYFVAYLGIFFFGMMRYHDLKTQILALTLWRAAGLIFILFFESNYIRPKEAEDPSYVSIVRERSFILYFVPWLMFCLINYLNIPILTEFFGEDFAVSSFLIEGLIIGVFAIVGGFLCDTIGRKRIIVSGFVMVGLGYAVLSVFPGSLISWYFYTIVDGVAWGMLAVTFLMALWGDLAYKKPSKKYYALGGLPFLFANTLQELIGKDLAKSISVSAVFPLTSLFLFLAVLPLIYAPETLPEKKIKERELKKYIEKAKKIKEKYD